MDCGCQDARTYPGAVEICDRVDNDCDLNLPAVEIDGDGDDVTPCEGDCSDADGGSFATPPEVAGVAAAPSGGGAVLDWDDLVPSSGTSTVYDVFSGLISDLHGPRGFRAGDCVAEDLGAPSMAAAGDDPPVGDARYYLVRGQNTCPTGDGTWGDPLRDAQVPNSPQACD